MKFNIGDPAKVISSGNESFLKHFLNIGEEVTITGFYTGYKDKEAYYIRRGDGCDYTEPILADELEKIPSVKQARGNVAIISTVKIVLSKFKITEDVTVYEMEIVGKSHTYKAYITESMYSSMKGSRQARKNDRGEYVVLE